MEISGLHLPANLGIRRLEGRTTYIEDHVRLAIYEQRGLHRQKSVVTPTRLPTTRGEPIKACGQCLDVQIHQVAPSMVRSVLRTPDS